MKPAPKPAEPPVMPLCGHPGCTAWGTFGDGRGHRCREHLWAGFLPGPDYVPGVLAVVSVAVEAQTPVQPLGSLL